MTGIVHGAYKQLGGAVAAGQLVITVNTEGQVVRDPVGNVVFQGPQAVKLNKDGLVTLTLPASDDSTLEPSGFTYAIVEQLSHVARTSYRIVEFQVTNGGTIELADLAATDEAALDPSYGANLNAVLAELDGRLSEGGLTASIAAGVGSAGRGGQRLVSLGDSITIASDDNSANAVRIDSVWDVVAARSGGAIKLVRNAGVGGNTSEAMLARFDTDVTPYNPTMVGLMAGSNDFDGGSFTVARYMTAMRALVAKIRGIGAVPIILNPPPINSLTSDKKKTYQQARNALALYCAAERITLIDLFGAAVLPNSDGAWRGYLDSGDGKHPLMPAGYISLGIFVSDEINKLALPGLPVLSKYNQDPTNMLTNGLFQANGLSLDGWGLAANPTSGTAPWSVVADGNMPGDYCAQAALDAALGATTRLQTVAAGAATFAPGDLLEFAAKVYSPIVAPAGYTSVLITFTGGAGSVLLKRYLDGYHIYQREFTVPAGTTALNVYLNAGVEGATAKSGNVRFGGLTLRKL